MKVDPSGLLVEAEEDGNVQDILKSSSKGKPKDTSSFARYIRSLSEELSSLSEKVDEDKENELKNWSKSRFESGVVNAYLFNLQKLFDVSKLSSWSPKMKIESLDDFIKEISSFEREKNIRIKLDDITSIEISRELKGIAEEIERSRYVYSLKDNFDEDGGKGYLRETWGRAIRFLCWYAEEIYGKSATILRTPDISGGPGGSIDIWWKLKDFRLLINIPENVNDKPSFYGDDRGESEIKGKFELDRINVGLLMCLANLR
ncbi:MAG TPA: hypothetical protein VMF88_06950 [Bacteroidota bacterium]|nr:hypothetical protein [Bacteroidota bacterium]